MPTAILRRRGAARQPTEAPDDAIAAVAETPLPLPHRAVRATRVVVHVLSGVALTGVVLPFLSAPRRDAIKRNWSRKLLRLLRVEARVTGAIDVHGGNVLLVANHVSWLDIFVLNAHRPARFVAKAELAGWPVAGRLIRGAGTIFVDRERRHDTRRVNHHAAQALAAGDVVAVFPEGTTTDGATLLRFHASLLQPIVEAKGHVLPVAIRYREASGAHSTAPAYVGDESFARSFWRVCSARRLVVDVHAAPALAAHGANRRELARAAEDAIRTALGLSVDPTAPGRSGDREA